MTTKTSLQNIRKQQKQIAFFPSAELSERRIPEALHSSRPDHVLLSLLLLASSSLTYFVAVVVFCSSGILVLLLLVVLLLVLLLMLLFFGWSAHSGKSGVLLPPQTPGVRTRRIAMCAPAISASGYHSLPVSYKLVYSNSFTIHTKNTFVPARCLLACLHIVAFHIPKHT